MASDDSSPTLKILMIGPSGAGKSALLIRYVDDQFDSESSTATIGVDFKTKKLSIHGTPYRLNLLDTAGQERFRTLSNSYYRGAHGVLLVYDISSRDSFASMERWFDEVDSNAMAGAKMYLVGTKLDRGEDLRKVSREEGEALARRRGAVGFCEVSAKTREGVRRPFVELLEGITGDEELMAVVKGVKRGETINVAGVGSGDGDSACAC